jgi:uncharacterized protein (TIGR01777 family)
MIMDLVLTLLCAQAVLGAIDTIWHHELKVALPRDPEARLELWIHAVRAMLYGALFYGLAWYQWGGAWVLLLIAIVAVEVVLTLWDFLVEDRTRVLPSSERVLHTVLAINGGAVFCLLALQLPSWWALPTGWIAADYGLWSIALTLDAGGVTAPGLRDAWAAWTLQRAAPEVRLNLGAARRLLISGGTGFTGSALVRQLLREGHDVTLVTRYPIAAAVKFAGRVPAVRAASGLSAEERFDAIVNLAGAPVVGPRWSRERRRILLASRLHATRDLLDFVHRARQRPDVWLQASAVGYYGTEVADADELSARGCGFAALLCGRWEALAARVDALGVRRVTLRLGLVFGRTGGALGPLLPSYRVGFGAVLGSGTQRVAWIHLEDLLRLLARALRDPSLRGTINAVAPAAPMQREFARVAAELIGRPLWLRLPARPLRVLLGEMADLFVAGPRIRALRLPAGFEFRYPLLRSALIDLV